MLRCSRVNGPRATSDGASCPSVVAATDLSKEDAALSELLSSLTWRRMLVPAAAERLIQRHLVGQFCLPNDNELLLSGIKRALRIKRGQVAVEPRAEADFSEAVDVAIRCYESFL
jgi:hypothetical protein